MVLSPTVVARSGAAASATISCASPSRRTRPLSSLPVSRAAQRWRAFARETYLRPMADITTGSVRRLAMPWAKPMRTAPESHGEATSSRARACHASAFPCASSADPHRSTQASTLALWGRGHRRPADARVRPCGRGEVWCPRGQVRQESEPWGGLRGPRTARPMWQMAKGTRGSNSMMGHAATRGLVRARCTCGGGKS